MTLVHAHTTHTQTRAHAQTLPKTVSANNTGTSLKRPCRVIRMSLQVPFREANLWVLVLLHLRESECVCACVCECMCMCVYVSLCAYKCLCVCVFDVGMYTQPAFMCVFMCIMRVCVCACVCVCVWCLYSINNNKILGTSYTDRRIMDKDFFKSLIKTT